MSFMQQLFGPRQVDVWRQLAAEVGGEFTEGGFLGVHRVQVPHRHWTITLDTHTVSTGQSSVTYTRLRAPFVNPSNFRFFVRRSNFFLEIWKAVGLKDIEVGSLEFDKEFLVMGNQEGRVKELFSDEGLRGLLRRQRTMQLTVLDDEGWFGPAIPKGVDELHFQVVGIIRDLEQLRGLIELFRATLDQLALLDAGNRGAVERNVAALCAPGGKITASKVLLWDCDAPRRAAARTLGQLQDPLAVPALLTALHDPDGELRSAAAQALGAIGDRRAVLPLIPLLGDGTSFAASTAAAALRQLGEGERVEAFTRLLGGDHSQLPLLGGDYHSAFVAAFIGTLRAGSASQAAHAATVLAEWGALEAREEVRAALRRFSTEPAAVTTRLQAALDRLGTVAALPRPAGDMAARLPQLPVPASPQEQAPDKLPRPVE